MAWAVGHMKRVFEQLEGTNVPKFKYDVSLLQKDEYEKYKSKTPSAYLK